jgi:hypothetical protein
MLIVWYCVNICSVSDEPWRAHAMPSRGASLDAPVYAFYYKDPFYLSRPRVHLEDLLQSGSPMGHAFA